MLADDLLDVVRAPRTRRGRQPVEWVARGPHIDAGPGATHRSSLADALVVALVVDLVERVPSARTYARKQAQSGRRIVVDHLAARVLDGSGVGVIGLDHLRSVIEPLGWRLDGDDVDGRGSRISTWSHLDRPDGSARWAIANLDPSGSDEVARVMERLVDTATSPIDDTTRVRLTRLAADGAIADRDAVELLPALIAAFGRRHRRPTGYEHEVLFSCDPSLAWLAREGTAVGHVADRVTDLAATVEEERISGRPMHPTTWTSESGTVRLAAHRLAMVRHGVPAAADQDANEEPTASFPGSTIAFVERNTQPDGRGDDSLDVACSLLTTALGSTDIPVAAATHPPDQPGGGHADADIARPDAARSVSRPAFTFKVRRRHLSEHRQAQFDEWIDRWGVSLDGPLLDWDAIFDRPEGHARRNGLDIGFGHGESTILMARADPELDVIGIEVHDPGVAAVLDAIEHEPLHNVRVVHGDVIRFLRRIDAASLDVIRIFFPDPWLKARQRHRRLVHADVVAALTDRLEEGGELHLATDIADYAEQMRSVCDAEPRLRGGVIPRPPERPLTRFERRGIDAGRVPVDLRYRRH